MQVDLLVTKRQCRAVISERDHIGAQHPGIEIARRLEIGNGQHNMVQPIDFHAFALRQDVVSQIRMGDSIANLRLHTDFALQSRDAVSRAGASR